MLIDKRGMVTMKVQMNKRIGRLIFYFLIVVFAIIIVFPFLWQILTSFKPLSEISSMPPKWLPSELNLEYYVNVFTKRPFLNYLLNSFIVSGVTTLISVLIGASCAYALARLRCRGKKIILTVVLMVSMFPPIANLSPLFVFMKNMKLINTYLALIIPYTAMSLTLTVWLLTNFFKDIPKGLEEAAGMDGCGIYRCFATIVLPLGAPGIFAAALITFITAWNEYLYALTFMTKDQMRTVPVGIALFPGNYDLPWGDIAAASVVVVVPLIIVVLIFQQKIIAGLTSGGVKE